MPFFRFIASLLSTAWIVQLGEEAFSIAYLCRGAPYGRKKMLFCRDFVCLFTLLFFVCFLLLYICPNIFIVMRYPSFLLVTLGYLLSVSKGSMNAKLIMAFSMSSASMCVSSISGQTAELCTKMGMNAITESIISTLLFAFLIPLAFFLRKYVLEDYENSIPNSGVLLISVGSVAILGLLIFECVQQGGSNAALSILLIISFAGTLLLILTGVYAIYGMCRDRQEMLQLQNEAERLRSEKEMSAMTAANLDDLRCIRHELKNQYAYMKLLIARQQYPELEAYCSRLAETVPEPLQMVDCGNNDLNILLNMWITKAKHKNIQVETRLIVPPMLPCSQDDLYSLISNLMDNAVEACQKKDYHNIRMEISPWRDYLSIVCSNPTDMTALHYRGGGLLTTKNDLRFHGYGTRIISRIAARNNGMVDYSIDDGWFVAKVLLDMNRKGSVSRENTECCDM